MSYYDLDAILTDAEKIPCIFNLENQYLGHLDNSSSGLKPATPLSLPLWLAEILALTTTANASTPPLQLDPPPCLSKAVIAALKADPRAVTLRDQNAHFYALAVRYLDMWDDVEMAQTSAVLSRTFAVRATDVGLHARKADEVGLGSRGEEFLRGLEEWERGLFRRGHESLRAVRDWTDGVKKAW